MRARMTQIHASRRGQVKSCKQNFDLRCRARAGLEPASSDFGHYIVGQAELGSAWTITTTHAAHAYVGRDVGVVKFTQDSVIYI